MSRASSLTIVASIALGFAVGSARSAAQVQEQRLTDPVSSFPKEFGMVGGLVELPDGRVMVADPLGQVLVVLDMLAGTPDTLGRVGQGPAEYRQPDGLFQLPGDSTLLVDLGNGRLTVLDPDLGFGNTTPIALGTPMSGDMMIRMPQAVDSRGRVYFQRMMGRIGPDGQMVDSAPVFRWDRATGEVDTVAVVKLEQVQVRRSGGANERSVAMSPVPMSPRDGWAVALDGRVAVVRCGDYHVDWLDSDGNVVSGPRVEYRPIRIRQADKEAWVDGLAGSGLSVGVENVNGQVTTSFRRGGGRNVRRDIESLEWPDVMPPFNPNRVHVSPEGMVWVGRYVSVGSPATFDVFDGSGQRVKQVTLPPGRRIAGFGDELLYAVRADEYDLQWIEVYHR